MKKRKSTKKAATKRLVTKPKKVATKKAATKRLVTKPAKLAKKKPVEKKALAKKAVAIVRKVAVNFSSKPRTALDEIRELMAEAEAKAKAGKRDEAIKMYEAVDARKAEFPRKAWRARQALAALGIDIQVKSPMSGKFAERIEQSRERAREEQEATESLMGPREKKAVKALKAIADKVAWFPIQDVFRVTRKATESPAFRLAVMERLTKAKLIGRIVDARSNSERCELVVRLV